MCYYFRKKVDYLPPLVLAYLLIMLTTLLCARALLGTRSSVSHAGARELKEHQEGDAAG